MQCGLAKEWMIDALFGELDAESRLSLFAHMQDCEACNRESASMNMLMGLSRSLQVSSKADLSDRVSVSIASSAQETSQENELYRLSADLYVTPSPDFSVRVAAAVAAVDDGQDSTMVDSSSLRQDLIIDYLMDNMEYDDRLILENTTLREAASFREFESLRDTLGTWQALTDIEPSAGFAAKVAAEVEILHDQIIDVSCEFARASMVDYIFNEVSELQDTAINMHLKECYPCKEEYESLMLTVETARVSGSVTPRPGFNADVIVKIQAYLLREKDYREQLANRSLPERVAIFSMTQIRRMPLVASSALLHAAMIFIILFNSTGSAPTLRQMSNKLPAQASSRKVHAAMAIESEASVAKGQDVLIPIAMASGGMYLSDPKIGFDGDDEYNASAKAVAGIKLEEERAAVLASLPSDSIENTSSQLWKYNSRLTANDDLLSQQAKVLFGTRIDAMARRRVLSDVNSVETDGVLRSAMNFLQRTQLDDGSWPVGGDAFGGVVAHRPGITALALLTFTGRGYAPGDGSSYGVTLDRGLNYLLLQQDDQGFIGRGHSAEHFMYSHGLATLVLLESAILSDNASLRTAAEKAVQAMLNVQLQNGAWGYNDDMLRGVGDGSITIWQMQALRIAREAGLNIQTKRIDAALLHALEYVDTLRTPKGRTAYDSFGRFQYGERAMTSADCFIRNFTVSTLDKDGKKKRRALNATVNKQQIAFMAEHAPSVVDVDYANPESVKDEANDFYYWYYASHAMRCCGEDAFSDWNSALKIALARLQTKQGDMAGAWEGRHGKFGRAGGTIYTTAMAMLTLESYYRYPANR